MKSKILSAALACVMLGGALQAADAPGTAPAVLSEEA